MVNFVDQWEWSRIGLIRDDTPYYHHAAELLHKKLTGTTRTITSVLTVTKVGGTSVLRQVKDYGTHIFILSMGGDTALLVLEEAEKLGYSWPEYAWLVFSTQSGSSYPKGVFIVSEFLNYFLSLFLNRSFGTNFGEFREGTLSAFPSSRTLQKTS